MIVSLIVAMDERRGIGFEGRLPWRLSADLKRFKALTMGHHLIAGRKTYESIGRPLPGRTMIIVTRDPDYQAEGCLIAHSVDEALALARARGETEAFIIGGAEIYAQTLERADRLYLTQVHAITDADVFFPAFDESAWREQEVSPHEAGEKNQYPSTFKLLVRTTD
ncbi:MAG TPA: dihydrofolate reductase [Blastocatellia bacterium]|nr:dihydrofolate reductase [Blastocatellia bacterium]